MNLRRLQPGRTLDVGCGLGRNLAFLHGQGVGVDHNAASVQIARRRGFAAYTPDEFLTSPDCNLASYDSLLFSHVVEHLSRGDALALTASYLPYVRPDGQVIFICPQKRGYASDPTHVELTNFDRLDDIAAEMRLRVTRRMSFPLPRWAGRYFTFNEFVVVARV